MAKELIEVHLALCWPNKQEIFTVKVEIGTSVAAFLASHQSLLKDWPYDGRYGIFREQVKGTYPLKEGDRIELYRPLIADAKAARLKRVKKNA